MATKKVHAKSAPKPKFKIMAIYNLDLDSDANEIHNVACCTKLDAFDVVLHEKDEVRDYVAILAHNYERVCRALAEARAVLKDPNVTHAVSVARRLEALETKLSEVESDTRQTRRDLECHEATNDHQRNGNYFFG